MSPKKNSTPKDRAEAPLPPGMQQTKEIRKRSAQAEQEAVPEPETDRWQDGDIQKEAPEAFSPMETGQPDQDPVPGSENPRGVQGGRGPLNEEGEGDRQNDQLAELEEIEPDLK